MLCNIPMLPRSIHRQTAEPNRPESAGGGGHPGAAPVLPHDAPRDDAATALRTLMHELANLVDGSARGLRLALDAMRNADDGPLALVAGRHLALVSAGLERASAVLREALRPAGALQGDRLFEAAANVAPPAATLGEAAHHAVQAVRAAADARSVSFLVELHGGVEKQPPGPVYSILCNALRNAVEACGSGGEVRVRAVHQQGSIVMTVSDNGRGLSDEELQHAFTQGYSGTGGSGLGLALCRRLAEQAGGNVTLSRAATDHAGAVLTLVLPSAPPVAPWLLNDWGE